MKKLIMVLLLGGLSGPLLAAPRPLIAAQSSIEFSVKQMGVAVSGRFQRFDATIDLDDRNLAQAKADVSVDIASLSTGDADADAIALDTPWLNRAQFPQARFVSRSISAAGPNRYLVTGTLSIRGRSRELSVPLNTQPQADGRLVASGSFTIRRADFGIGGGEWNEDDLVANEVPVSFRLTLGAPR